MTYEVGQTLFAVYSLNRRVPLNVDVVVTCVGRKWIYFRPADRPTARTERFDMRTGYIDGGDYTSPGKVYPGREAYVSEIFLAQAWDDFSKRVYTAHLPPKGVTVEDIEAAEKLIFGGGA